MNKKLIIFPTKKQLEYLVKKNSTDNFYVIVRDKDAVDESNIIRVINGEEKLLGNNVDVLCCHEEGMYWLRTHGNANWNNIFLPNMVNLVTKKSFKECLIKNGIKSASFCEDEAQIQEYPIIAKPIVGFGSIGVKRIDSENELKLYLSETSMEEMQSRIKPYKDKYFQDMENTIIFEEFIPGDFYRTPFVVYDNEIRYIFPVKGNKTTYRRNSDFHWTDFEYGVNERNIASYLKGILENLKDLFKLQSGVYVAEFIVNEDNEVYLLEFSPRQTSDRIARIIQLASGIDLEQLAIDLFLGEKIQEISLNRTIRMQILRSEDTKVEGNYLFIEKKEEGSVYGDRITTMYTEKVQIYE